MHTRTHITTTINGEPREFLCEPRQSLLECLRAQRAGVQVMLFMADQSSLSRIGTACGRQGYHPLYAIVGGTGRYHGASGSYVASQRPAGAGGDGSADFTFMLQA